MIETVPVIVKLEYRRLSGDNTGVGYARLPEIDSEWVLISPHKSAVDRQDDDMLTGAVSKNVVGRVYEVD